MVSQFPVSPAPPVEPISGSVRVLYAVYLEVAACDHRCRVAALYGTHEQPTGHTPFRPLRFDDFVQRYESSCLIVGGEDVFRRQLARWAKVHGIDCVTAVRSRVAA